MKFAYASGSRPLEGYTIKHGVGVGGFGEVYYATSDGGKDVALKAIRRNLDIELRGVKQCLNLKHPNLVELYDMRQDPHGESWVVMEYMRGDCLERVLAKHPQGLDEPRAREWIEGIAAAVAYLHDQGIVHRDLKPANIFREPVSADRGLVKLGDYGLSKFISVSRRSGQTESVGTVHYMAPEVGNGRYGKEIDLYALGILTYELLTGHVPFEGESVGEVLMKHLTAQPDLSHMPAPYRSAVAACLQKDPAARPKNVAEFLSMLPGGATADRQVRPPQGAPTMKPSNAPVPWGPLNEPTQQLSRWWDGLSLSGKALSVAIACTVTVHLLRTRPLIAETSWSMIAFGVIAYFVARKVLPKTSTVSSPAGAGAPRAPSVDRVAYAPKPPADSSPEMDATITPPATAQRSTNLLAELTGSMLVAAGVSAMSVGLAMAAMRTTGSPEQFAWQTIMATLGSWFVIGSSRLWHGTTGDEWMRRLAMVCGGLALGTAGWALDQWLMIDMHYGKPLVRSVVLPWADGNFDVTGQPHLQAYLAYFGLLFLVPRWWRMTDPLRRKRVRLMTVAMCSLLAVGLNALWAFPQPWGLLVVAPMALAVQVASPWTRRYVKLVASPKVARPAKWQKHCKPWC